MDDHNPYGDDADDNLGLMPPNELDMARDVLSGIAAAGGPNNHTANILIVKNGSNNSLPKEENSASIIILADNNSNDPTAPNEKNIASGIVAVES